MTSNFQELHSTQTEQDGAGNEWQTDYYNCPICGEYCVSEHQIDFTVYVVFDRFDEFIGVFSDKENAEKVKGAIGQHAWIEECELDKRTLT